MNWRMWTTISGWLMAVLLLIYVAGEYFMAGEDLWEIIGGHGGLLDEITSGVILPAAAIVFVVSALMERLARR